MENKSYGGGIGVLGILQIIFIVLKVLGVGVVANWSWWVVLIPLWIELGIIALVIIIDVIISIISISK